LTVASVSAQIRVESAQRLEVTNTVSIAQPANWSVAPIRAIGVKELINVSADRQGVDPVTANIKMNTESRRDHEEAILRLHQIATGYGAPPDAYLVIDGWPALQFVRLEERRQPSQGPKYEDLQVLRVTTAVAVGNTLVRAEAYLPSKANRDLIDEVKAIGQSLVFASQGEATQVQSEIEGLRRMPHPEPAPVVAPGPEQGPVPDSEEGGSAADTEPGFNVRVNAGNLGELEIAVSNNGLNIVMGTNGGWHFSTNGGQTWAPSAGIGNNDPSAGFGVSGAFYGANIRGNCQPADAAGPQGYTCTGMWRSTNNGANFGAPTNAVVCPNDTTPPSVPGACFPDQEHIAVDRFNAAPGGDQVYSAWRGFGAGVNNGLVCSQNNGATWTAPLELGAGDFPRITVGSDGFVYVVWYDGGNYVISKFSSCANGLALVFGPNVLTGRTPVACPFPGHDRCDQNPTSQTITVDDTNPSHLYFAYGQNTAAGNDDVFVRDSLDGGATWPAARVVRANAAISSPRIMPWVCVTGGEAYATWYDRRGATPCPAPPCPGSNNDLTDMYAGKVGLDFNSNLVALGDFRITEVGDPWCGTGAASDWPCGTRGAPGASESCSVQPQLAGVCCNNGLPNCPGSQQACDFSDGGCPAGETCNGGNGCPKYGDYNGNACIAGRLYAGWASATSPPGINPPSTSIGVFFNAQIVGDVPQIQIPGNVTIADTCIGSTGVGTLDVCNTGTANLEVGSITSSSARFVVTTPTSGYPVVISPDFCFPFQVRFTPTSAGPLSATLTVASNDPSQPSVNIQVSSEGIVPNIATIIADNGSFGDVCRDTFRDLTLIVSNSGGCDLTISDVTSSSLDFQVPNVGSLVVGPGDSIKVPIRFAPPANAPFGAKNGTITVVSDDPDTPNKQVAVSGNVPPGDIRVTGSTDFGDVCAGAQAEKEVSVCNVGECNLIVSSVEFVGNCPDFTLINNPFPAPVSPDSCEGVTIRFTPTSCGEKSCTLRITSDDPDTPVVDLIVTANTPCSEIDVSPDQCFSPTVIQSVGACNTLESFPISNKGSCPIKIPSITLGGANSNAYFMSGLPSFPINLQPGHTVGDGDLDIGFAPITLSRDTLASIDVTYETDPITHATTVETRILNGEGVRTGARVLVTHNKVAVPLVEKLMIQRITGNRNRPLLNTVDNAMNLLPITVTPAAPCGSFQYHREYSTVSNPIQLLPGSYRITATAKVNGKKYTKTIGFDVNTCGFNANIAIELP